MYKNSSCEAKSFEQLNAQDQTVTKIGKKNRNENNNQFKNK